MDWSKISFILCVFGFLKEFRPNEPFVTDYLTGPWKNFTNYEVNQEIYPVGTYSYLAMLIAVFLLTDFIRYKPVIILCGLSGAATFTVIVLGKTIAWMKVVEVLYGIFLSSEVAYYTYIYAKVDKQHYQKVTSHTRSAFLLGRFISSVIAQLTVSFKILDYEQLNYITIGAHLLASGWALFLPSVGQSTYFHRPDCVTVQVVPRTQDTFSEDSSCMASPTESGYNVASEYVSFTHKVKRAYYYLWKDFLKAYSNAHVFKWSLWWACATCGYLQVISYIQLLWQTAVGNHAEIYNGAVEAIFTIIGVLAVFCVGLLRLNWPLVGEATLSILSFLQGALLLIASRSENIWVLYAMYITFGVIYHSAITIASFEVAKYLSEDSYSLIFGINTFVALLLQSILTYIVISPDVFELSIRPQYIVYGGYFVVLGIGFMITAIVTIARILESEKSVKIWLTSQDKLADPHYEFKGDLSPTSSDS